MVYAKSYLTWYTYIIFVSTQNTQVVLQGVLTKESEEKQAEVHEQVETCGGHVDF